MKFKRLLLIAIMIASMAVMTACSGGSSEAPTTDESETVEETETGEEVVPKDGTYTASATASDGSGEIEVEIVVEGSSVKDFQVKTQEGIEIDEATIEDFKVELLDKQSPENVVLEEISGEEQQISILMNAYVNAYILSLIG